MQIKVSHYLNTYRCAVLCPLQHAEKKFKYVTWRLEVILGNWVRIKICVLTVMWGGKKHRGTKQRPNVCFGRAIHIPSEWCPASRLSGVQLNTPWKYTPHLYAWWAVRGRMTTAMLTCKSAERDPWGHSLGLLWVTPADAAHVSHDDCRVDGIHADLLSEQTRVHNLAL